MKKSLFFAAFGLFTIVANAQTEEHGFYSNKFFDNWYIGLNGGAATKTTNQPDKVNINGNAGLRIGKWLTPSFGLAAEGNYYFTNKANGMSVGQYINANFGENLEKENTAYWTAGVLATLNISNCFWGYPGQPRKFDVNFVTGIYWGQNTIHNHTVKNMINHKIGFDFNYNFGKNREWSVYAEPAIIFNIAGVCSDEFEQGFQSVKYHSNASFLQLNLGVNYKFKTSNKTHNFLIVQPRDQKEIDVLNAEINNLRAQNAADNDQIQKLKNEIDNLKKALDDCEKTPKEIVKYEPNLPAIFYQLNKSVITPEQANNVAIAAKVMQNHPELKIQIKGYASPEGPHDNNMSLGVRRANAVKDMLVKKYGIDPERITAEGCGETDKLFEIYEFNRVAMLYIEK
ncbi:MAG: OmpA family protein [Bacteroidales bacterium]|nr:OmpA family protein [Bacteroidales bacterium]MCM1147442.1 OmpA family protein [Bacteroidales bacterium]MCM1206111.1 OmpA family protein [Bacillota bacterium]MCM1510058.1 OmpA family protein [Clostridium sp.]